MKFDAFNPTLPYRKRKPRSSKMIFLAMEGSVTEEEYVKILMNTYSSVASRIKLLSVIDDIVQIPPEDRSADQHRIITSSDPKHMVQRLDNFKKEKEFEYDLSKHIDDEYWIVVDIDDHLIESKIDAWNDVISDCNSKGYKYAVSNPFFELYILLHFDDVNENDESYAVTLTNSYKVTSHFRDRVNLIHHVFTRKKHLDSSFFNDANIRQAISRAEQMHLNKTDYVPMYLCSTFYRIVNLIIELVDTN